MLKIGLLCFLGSFFAAVLFDLIRFVISASRSEAQPLSRPKVNVRNKQRIKPRFQDDQKAWNLEQKEPRELEE